MPNLNDIARLNGEGPGMVYGKGRQVTAIPVFSKDRVGIALVQGEAGADILPHNHGSSAEWLIVLDGKIEVERDGQWSVIEAGNYAHASRHAIHQTRFLENSRILAISVPLAAGFPTDKTLDEKIRRLELSGIRYRAMRKALVWLRVLKFLVNQFQLATEQLSDAMTAWLLANGVEEELDREKDELVEPTEHIDDD